MVTAMLLLHVTLAFPPHALPPLALRSAVAEAAAIWAPYGVTIDAVASCGCPGDRAPLLVVAIAPSSAPGVDHGWRGPLGTIGFDADGLPVSTLTLYLADIERLLRGAGVFGGDQYRWPTSLHERVLGRAVGRVIAHEIGHYVLRTRAHAAAGLMRPVHTTDQLAAPSRHGFELSDAELLRLK